MSGRHILDMPGWLLRCWYLPKNCLQPKRIAYRLTLLTIFFTKSRMIDSPKFACWELKLLQNMPIQKNAFRKNLLSKRKNCLWKTNLLRGKNCSLNLLATAKKNYSQWKPCRLRWITTVAKMLASSESEQGWWCTQLAGLKLFPWNVLWLDPQCTTLSRGKRQGWQQRLL